MRIIDAMDAAGKSIVLLETVGTGQSEMDVAEVADVRVVVAAPGLGDDIQAMKAGLLEIADILVVNKADREGAERTAAELKAALGFRSDQSRAVPVLKTVALSGEGVAALADACLAVARSPTRMDGARPPPAPRPHADRAGGKPTRRQSRPQEHGSPRSQACAKPCCQANLAPDTAARRLLRIDDMRHCRLHAAIFSD